MKKKLIKQLIKSKENKFYKFSEIEKLLCLFLILCIDLYKILISPIFGLNCKFFPSCSKYSKLALKKHGFLKGIYYSIRRILKCNPWNKRGGYDPVP